MLCIWIISITSYNQMILDEGNGEATPSEETKEEGSNDEGANQGEGN